MKFLSKIEMLTKIDKIRSVTIRKSLNVRETVAKNETQQLLWFVAKYVLTLYLWPRKSHFTAFLYIQIQVGNSRQFYHILKYFCKSLNKKAIVC